MTTITTNLVGVSFRSADARDIVRSLEIGDMLELREDFSNPHDANAVAVYKDNVHLGFIAAKDNGPIAALIREGEEFEAEVVAFEGSLRPVLEIDIG